MNNVRKGQVDLQRILSAFEWREPEKGSLAELSETFVNNKNYQVGHGRPQGGARGS